jgi:hypothetical protein
MAGPTASMAHVPLREVLPHDYLSADGELRRLANELESHPSAADRMVWHWYPHHREPPQTSNPRLYLLLVDTTITLYNTPEDGLELTLDIAWLAPPKLTVSAAVEVTCWCPHDHSTHQVRQGQWHVGSSQELVEAFAAGTAMLKDVLASGPFEPHPWRIQAGLPDAPETSR